MHIGTDGIVLMVIAVVLFGFPLWMLLFEKNTGKPSEGPTVSRDARDSAKTGTPENKDKRPS
jgi:hypothetical protein